MKQIKVTFDKTTGCRCLAWDDIAKVFYPMAADDVLRPELERNLGKDIADRIWPEVSGWCAFYKQYGAYEKSKDFSAESLEYFRKNGFELLLRALEPSGTEPLHPPLSCLDVWQKILNSYGVEIVKE